jgi:glycosyltransferase involved in cell wall biosynthesis
VKKRFGTVFPFVEAGRQPRRIGRLVANHDFVRALLKYARFDEFVFSNPSVTNLRAFAESVRTWGLPEERLGRVRFVSYVGLPSLLSSEPFHVFHLGGWGWFMAGLHYVRARYASNPWPITAVTHSLTGREIVDHAVRISHARMAPYDAIFCTSRDGREAMHRLLDGGARIAGRAFSGRLEHLPLGVDDDLLDAAGDGARGRQRLRIPPDAVVLLVLGRITPWQKMDLAPLIDAFAGRILPESRRPVVLLLAGSAGPEDLEQVKNAVAAARAEASVRVYANFPAEQKRDLLAASDILVSPVDNAQETFGLSLLEAGAAGLPVVASHYDGYKDLVRDGVDGFLVETVSAPEDPMAEWFDLMDPNLAQLFQAQGVAVDMRQLADRVLRLIHDDGLRASMGRAGRTKVDREYRWSRVIERYEECWDRLAADARTAGIVPPAEAENPYNVAGAGLFTHYATRTLAPDDWLCLDAAATPQNPYSEVAPLLEGTLARWSAPDAGSVPASVADLVPHEPAARRLALFGLAWLLKNGRVRRVNAPAGDSPSRSND